MRIYDEGGQASLFAPDGSAGRMSPACSAAASLKGRTSGSSWNRSPELQTIPYLSLDLTPGAFGLDTTTRANIMSAVYTAQAAVNTTRTIVQAVK